MSDGGSSANLDENRAQSFSVVNKFLTSSLAGQNVSNRLEATKANLMGGTRRMSVTNTGPAPPAPLQGAPTIDFNNLGGGMTHSMSVDRPSDRSMTSSWPRAPVGETRFPTATFNKACGTDDLVRVVTRGTNTVTGPETRSRTTNTSVTSYNVQNHISNMLSGGQTPALRATHDGAVGHAPSVPHTGRERQTPFVAFKDAYTARRASLDRARPRTMAARGIESRADLHRLNSIANTLAETR